MRARASPRSRRSWSTSASNPMIAGRSFGVSSPSPMPAIVNGSISAAACAAPAGSTPRRGATFPVLGPAVGIIMGSQSDWETMRHAAETLDKLGVPHERRIVSAHRTPKRLVAYAEGARQRGLKVIIAGAGGAAHLPGMVASLTPLPVLGVPISSAALDGLDALLSIAQMPRGVPVASVAIGNATNAGLLAVRLLASSDSALQHK